MYILPSKPMNVFLILRMSYEIFKRKINMKVIAPMQYGANKLKNAFALICDICLNNL